MIEQYTITATQRYNFPPPTMDTTLPQRFIEQSIHSLKHVHNEFIQLNQQAIQQPPSFDMQSNALQLKAEPIVLKPRHEETVIAACDTSTIKIGETSTGVLVAVRGASVCKQNRSYRYKRLGPFVFHITEENKREVYNTLERAYFSSPYGQNHESFPNLLQVPTRIAGLLEKWLQAMLSRTVCNGLVLFDGSLTAGIGDSPACRLREILANARKNGDVVLAFSKMTNLRVNGYLITDLPFNHKPPYLLETFGLRPKPPIVLLGDVYVAKLTHGNCAFRLDVDRECSAERKVEAVERLLGGDVVSQSYPETLRLAHILCTFTANEVLAMQHFAVRKCGLRMVNRPDIHRLLFGPFGRGECYS